MHDNVCEFALCFFNLFDRISPGCPHEFNIIYVYWEKFVILQQHMKYTFSRTKIKENH